MTETKEIAEIEFTQASLVQPPQGTQNEPEVTTLPPPLVNEEASGKIFVRKVLIVLLIQLLSSAFIVLFFAFTLKDYSRGSSNFRIDLFFVFMSTIIILFVLAYFKNARVKTYYNYFLLGVFTYGIAYAVGVVCARHSEIEVIIAYLSAITIALLLIRFTIPTAVDLTNQVNLLTISLSALVLTTMEMIFSFYTSIVTSVILGIFNVLIFCIYLIAGVHFVKNTDPICILPTDEYIFAALFTYLIFMYFYLRIWIIVNAIFQYFRF